MNLAQNETVNYTVKAVDGQELHLKKGGDGALYEIEHRDGAGNLQSLKLTRRGLGELRWMIGRALSDGGAK